MPDRWEYGYETVDSASYLDAVAAPDPADPGTLSSDTIAYNAAGLVQSVTDATNRVRSYTPSATGAPSMGVALKNGSGQTALTWSSNYQPGALQDTGFTDAVGKTEAQTYTDPNNPFSPTQVTNRNGQVSNVVYNDAYGNLQTVTTPRGDVVANTYTYTNFLFGQSASTPTTSSTVRQALASTLKAP